MTVIELVVTAGLLSVVAAMAIPHLPRSQFGLQQSQAQLLADMRLTRSDALAKGDHFRLKVNSATTYAEYRLALQADNVTWAVTGGAIRNRTLPTGITFTTGVNSTFEFNTRGLMIHPDAALTLTLKDATTSHTRNVTVYPSGQVASL